MTSELTEPDLHRKKVYLAGPEVFLPNALELGKEKKRICAEHGFEGVFPLDLTISTEGLDKVETAYAIAGVCIELMDQCDLAIANMTPFRGVSMDVGTAVELGYLTSAEKLVFGYTNVDDLYIKRVEAMATPDGYDIEDFDLTDNLMCEGVIRRSGGKVVRHSAKPSDLFTDMSGFKVCVAMAADLLAN